MSKPKLSNGIAHKLPLDLTKALSKTGKIIDLWEDLTPIARNEFICWVENAKQEKTRTHRIKRTIEELLEGKRRPCCWIGCVHRKDKPMSPSQKYILGKQSKK